MTQMTQSIEFSNTGALRRLGHLARWRGQSMTQMTQLCKIRIIAIYLQLGVDSVKQSLTIATLANKKPVSTNLK
jgi:hypothetical protein